MLHQFDWQITLTYGVSRAQVVTCIEECVAATAGEYLQAQRPVLRANDDPANSYTLVEVGYYPRRRVKADDGSHRRVWKVSEELEVEMAVEIAEYEPLQCIVTSRYYNPYGEDGAYRSVFKRINAALGKLGINPFLD